MATTLDRKRPFGEVWGNASHAYEQDGQMFDHTGELVSDQETIVPKRGPGRPKAAPVDPVADVTGDPQVDAQLAV